MLRQLSVVPFKSIRLALNIHAALFSVLFFLFAALVSAVREGLVY